MNAATRPLALELPLHGSRLIEASAGTGKTYTISALYLRLILGHGGEAGFARPLLPPQILVVTFTEAATRELRDRIRQRLVEAAAVFAGADSEDALLLQLRADYAPSQWPECARQLELAAQWMDEAAVATIHGWCQRMLREHAFDSGSLFRQTLDPDPSERRQAVVRDYWRQQAYPLQGQELAWVRRHWGGPAGLGRLLAGPLHDPRPAPEESLQALLQHSLQQRAQALAQLQQPWHEGLPRLASFLQAAQGQLHGGKLGPKNYQPRLARLQAWLEQPEAGLDTSKDYFQRFTRAGLLDACKATANLEIPAAIGVLLDAMAELPARLAALPAPDEAALRHAAGWVRRRFAQEQRQRAEIGFDDMLTQLDQALQGPQGAHLAEVIRHQFPLAMVDEFQDTDPVQYRIFDRIYQVATPNRSCGLLMIGDPKQAIYAFRGADIHTYLQARAATTGRHYALDTNYRSSTAMVAAVNQLFERAEQRPEGRGAFLFRTQAHNPLPFVPVRAQGRREIWTLQGQPAPALNLWQLPSDTPLSGEAYRQALAEAAASELVRLLNLAREGQAGFADAHGLRPLQPGDIAVLVRDGKEARAIREAMARRGIRSVYLSDKDSVFASQEARDILTWLQACAEPGQDRLLRTALASRSLDLPLAELERLNQDELAWEQRLEQFRDYHLCWQRQGVLPMLRRLIHDFELPRQLMRQRDGERRLTNVLHLAELLQQAAAEHEGEQALIRHLSERLQDRASPSQEQVIRLESDEALLRVITIHKSKGLEYPLVFLPFIAGARRIEAGQSLLLPGDPPQWIWQPDEAQQQQAEDERLGEDLRLLYVALTRARHACWLGLADRCSGHGARSELHHTAIGYLLGGGQALTASPALQAWLQPLAVPAQTVTGPAPAATESRYTPTSEQAFTPQWREPRRQAAEHWWVASYSALRLDENAGPGLPLVPDTASMQNALDEASPDPLALPASELQRPSSGMHLFPRGAEPGTFLHGLLELAAEESFRPEPAALRDALARRCERRDLTAWIDTLLPWLLALLQQPLPLMAGGQISLAALSRYQSEMEFWFQASRVEVETLDRLVCHHELPGLARPPLQANQLNGMFKGFIDLCFEAEGRYYVLDYKSNWLGPDAEAYTLPAMTAAILEHRYELQYVLYILALHRQLQRRLPDYDYERHIGGAVYWFVRAPANGLFQARPARALIEALDQLFRGASSETAA